MGCAGKGTACNDDAVYVKLVAGYDGVCGLDSDGWETCWGAPENGALLDEPFIALDLEAYLVCGITASGQNVCWGADVPGAVPPDGEFVDVAVSEEVACWTDAGGLVTCVGDPCDGDHDGCDPLPPTVPLTGVAGGRNMFCGLDEGSALACWGWETTWDEVPASDITEIDAGRENICTVRTSGDVSCTYVLNGAEGSEPTYGVGSAATGPGPWSALAAGHGFACVLDMDGGLECSSGMYDGPGQAVTVPTGPFLDLAAGGSSSRVEPMLCASMAAGGVSCWTWSDYRHGVVGGVCDAPWASVAE
jgi:hypothetical protein